MSIKGLDLGYVYTNRTHKDQKCNNNDLVQLVKTVIPNKESRTRILQQVLNN